MKIDISSDANTASEKVAQQIVDLVRQKPQAVLGLATGNTPIAVYESLVRLHRQGLNFSGVTCFNLDEYYLMDKTSPHSYDFFMRKHLFDHVTFRAHHIPDGSEGSQVEIAHRCRQYDELIKAAGGIDFQLLGIGSNGHAGFNEPGSPLNSRTRLVDLADTTRADAAKEFDGLEHVPQQAITMGMANINEAANIAFLITGTHKAPIAKRALTETPSIDMPATLLRNHKSISFYLDEAAARELPASLRPSLIERGGYRATSLQEASY